MLFWHSSAPVGPWRIVIYGQSSSSAPGKSSQHKQQQQQQQQQQHKPEGIATDKLSHPRGRLFRTMPGCQAAPSLLGQLSLAGRMTRPAAQLQPHLPADKQQLQHSLQVPPGQGCFLPVQLSGSRRRRDLPCRYGGKASMCRHAA